MEDTEAKINKIVSSIASATGVVCVKTSPIINDATLSMLVDKLRAVGYKNYRVDSVGDSRYVIYKDITDPVLAVVNSPENVRAELIKVAIYVPGSGLGLLS